MPTQPSAPVSMTDPDDEAGARSQLSAHDGEMLEQLLTGMLQHRMHVVLSSATAALAARQRALLLERLCDAGAVQVDEASSWTTELLLQRFNARVAALPMEQAMDRGGRVAGPVTVFVLRPTAPAPSAELRLLARLANDFPGANVRILLVLDHSVDVPGHVQALGRNVLHWAIRPDGADLEGRKAATPAVSGQAAAAAPGDVSEPDPAPEGAEPAGDEVERSAATGPSPRLAQSLQSGWRRAASCFVVGALGLSAVVAATQSWTPDPARPAAGQQSPAFELQRSPACGTTRPAGCTCSVDA